MPCVVLVLISQGDGNIRYFELDDERPYCHALSEFKTSAPQRGIGFMAKRGCNISECEIAKVYKLHPKGFVEIIGFTVPRKVCCRCSSCLGPVYLCMYVCVCRAEGRDGLKVEG